MPLERVGGGTVGTWSEGVCKGGAYMGQRRRRKGGGWGRHVAWGVRYLGCVSKFG